jgi:hypothetical protein
MFTYPQGKLVGSIGASAYGLCSDTNGNVYVLYRNAATEYAHGSTTPIRTLRIPGAEMYSCAVDPSTGNVALTFSCPPCGYQNLAIFPNGTGTATRYTAPLSYTSAYDDQGNLFLAGSFGTGIAELPSGSQTFTSISLNEDVGNIGPVQWDGSYITLQPIQGPLRIYRIAVSGSSGTVVGETKLGRYMKRIGNSSIVPSDGTFVVPFSSHGSQTHTLGIWNYPKPGHVIKLINKIGAGDFGFGAVAVSVAPSR